MRYTFIFIVLALIFDLAHGQLVAPPPPALRPISNPNMVIQFGGQRIEVLPTNRAAKIANGHYSVVDASPSELMTQDKLLVGYSYASNAKILMNGDISVRLKAGYSIQALGSLAAGSKLLAPPHLYVLSASTPLDLVRWISVLQANPAVEWAEPYIIKARITE